VTFQSWLDTTNTEFGMPASGTGGVQNLTPGISNTINTEVPFAVPFSLTNQFEWTVGSSGGVTSFDGLTTVTTPAPAGLLLLVSGLPVFGFAWLRRRKAKAQSV
jgi:hypothetical protein